MSTQTISVLCMFLFFHQNMSKCIASFVMLPFLKLRNSLENIYWYFVQLFYFWFGNPSPPAHGLISLLLLGKCYCSIKAHTTCFKDSLSIINNKKTSARLSSQIPTVFSVNYPQKTFLCVCAYLYFIKMRVYDYILCIYCVQIHWRAAGAQVFYCMEMY